MLKEQLEIDEKGTSAKQSRKMLSSYGVQMEDVPGEISSAIGPNTAEKSVVDRDAMVKTPVREQLCEDPDEFTSLLRQPSSHIHRLQDNLLYVDWKTDGFVMIYEASKPESLTKVRNLVRAVRRKIRGVPIMLLENKVDMIGIGDKAADGASYARKERPPLTFFTGSVTRNEFRPTRGSLERYTVEQIVDKFIQQLHKQKRGLSSAEYLAAYGGKSKKNKKWRGKHKGTASGGFFSSIGSACCCCCVGTSTEDGDGSKGASEPNGETKAE